MFIIDDDFLFVHVPRTGGFYTRKMLTKNHHHISRVGLEKDVYIKLPIRTRLHIRRDRPQDMKIQESHISRVKPHDALLYKPNNLRIFSMIRNPFSWYVSYYLRLLHGLKDSNSFADRFDRIPNYGDFIERMHCNVDDVLRHDDLSNELSRYFNIDCTTEYVNGRINGESYVDIYTDDLKDKVYKDSKDIIHKYGFEFGGI